MNNKWYQSAPCKGILIVLEHILVGGDDHMSGFYYSVIRAIIWQESCLKSHIRSMNSQKGLPTS